MTKSHVTMEQKVCIVCTATYDTNAILLDLKLRERFDMRTVTGWGMCPSCVDKSHEYVALVECKSAPIDPDDADRTGRIAHVRKTAWPKLFNVPIPNPPIAFVDPHVIGLLEKLQCGNA